VNIYVFNMYIFADILFAKKSFLHEPRYFGKMDPDPHESEKPAGSALMSKFMSFSGSKRNHKGPWTLTMEAWRLRMQPLMFCRTVIAEEQDPDPDLNENENSDLDLDPHLSKKRGTGSLFKK